MIALIPHYSNVECTWCDEKLTNKWTLSPWRDGFRILYYCNDHPIVHPQHIIRTYSVID
jgi:hypothetical protein